MHGLTGYHTQTREDRNDHITILWDNIQSDAREEFEYCTGCCCDTWDEPYDCSSVMHYAYDQFNLHGEPTMGRIIL